MDCTEAFEDFCAASNSMATREQKDWWAWMFGCNEQSCAICGPYLVNLAEIHTTRA